MMKQTISRAFASSALALLCQLTGSPLALAADELTPAVVRFDISRFDVVGNSLLPNDVIEAAVAPFTGKGRDFGDVQKALEALEAAYHQRGFNVVQVELPEQELNQGVVR